MKPLRSWRSILTALSWPDFHAIRVIHGHGAGILRRGVREFLKSHPHVATLAEAPQNEGGQGATLVELRQ